MRNNNEIYQAICSGIEYYKGFLPMAERASLEILRLKLSLMLDNPDYVTNCCRKYRSIIQTIL